MFVLHSRVLSQDGLTTVSCHSLNPPGNRSSRSTCQVLLSQCPLRFRLKTT